MLPVERVCLGMKPTQRKVKVSTEGGEGGELTSSFEPTESLCLEARVHFLLGRRIQFNILCEYLNLRSWGHHINDFFPNAKVRNVHTTSLTFVELCHVES